MKRINLLFASIRTRGTILASGLVLACALSGCQTKYVVITEPGGAVVYTGGKKIGNSPVKIVGSNLNDAKKAGGYLVEIKKPGYLDTVVVFPDDYGTAEMYLILEPDPTTLRATAKKSYLEPKVFSGDMLTLLGMQMRVVQGEEVDVKVLGELAKKYPDSGTASLILALDAWRNDNADEARVFARTAIDRSPDDQEIVDTARGILSGKDGGQDE